MIKVGVVGLGQDGPLALRDHATPIPRSKLAASATPPATCSACWRSTPASAAYSDYDAMLREADLDAVMIATPVAHARADGAGGARARPARVLREAVHASTGATSDELAALARRARAWSTQVGYHNRFVGAFERGQAAARRRRDRRGHPRPRRGLRAGGAEAQGRHLAQPARPRAAAASTTTPRTRSTCSTGTSAQPIGGRRHRAEHDLLARDRRRGLQHALLRRRQERAALGQLVRRVATAR